MADPEFIFKVEDTFTIPGRGICAVGLKLTQLGGLRPGDRIELRRPDATVLSSVVMAVEWRQIYAESPPPIDEQRFPVLLPPPLSQSDVPPGTQVSLVERARL
jgi:hypothetical protein